MRSKVGSSVFAECDIIEIVAIGVSTISRVDFLFLTFRIEIRPFDI
jgi:hypothetical protein